MNWKAQLANLGPEIIKGGLSLLSGWLLARLLTKDADLISYTSHVQTVNIPAQGQTPAGVRVEESTTGFRCSLSVSTVSGFVPG